jgi:hypothetical protein
VWLWSIWRARRLVYGWAESNGYRIESCKYRWFSRGPMALDTSTHQRIFAVILTTPDGESRAAWVRAGGWMFGLLSSEITVRWEE